MPKSDHSSVPSINTGGRGPAHTENRSMILERNRRKSRRPSRIAPRSPDTVPSPPHLPPKQRARPESRTIHAHHPSRQAPHAPQLDVGKSKQRALNAPSNVPLQMSTITVLIITKMLHLNSSPSASISSSQGAGPRRREEKRSLFVKYDQQ